MNWILIEFIKSNREDQNHLDLTIAPFTQFDSTEHDQNSSD
jgi:hypothetical protein